MPLYEYHCPKCGDFEVQQKISDPPLKKHGCGRPVNRNISLSSFHLKGGGWYADGYGSKGSASGSKPSADSSKPRAA